MWTVRAINKIIQLIQYFTIVVGGAGSGVLRPRLVTADSGGPGHRLGLLKLQGFLTFFVATPDASPTQSARAPSSSDNAGERRYVHESRAPRCDQRLDSRTCRANRAGRLARPSGACVASTDDGPSWPGDGSAHQQSCSPRSRPTPALPSFSVMAITYGKRRKLGSRPRARGKARRPSFDHSSMAKPPA